MTLESLRWELCKKIQGHARSPGIHGNDCWGDNMIKAYKLNCVLGNFLPAENNLTNYNPSRMGWLAKPNTTRCRFLHMQMSREPSQQNENIGKKTWSLTKWKIQQEYTHGVSAHHDISSSIRKAQSTFK
jgi:hypothetical protein